MFLFVSQWLPPVRWPTSGPYRCLSLVNYVSVCFSVTPPGAVAHVGALQTPVLSQLCFCLFLSDSPRCGGPRRSPTDARPLSTMFLFFSQLLPLVQWPTSGPYRRPSFVNYVSVCFSVTPPGAVAHVGALQTPVLSQPGVVSNTIYCLPTAQAGVATPQQYSSPYANQQQQLGVAMQVRRLEQHIFIWSTLRLSLLCIWNVLRELVTDALENL